MIDPKIVNETKVIIGPCRLSYTHVFEKYTVPGSTDEGKYQTNVLIPKKEKATIEAINKAIEAAKKQGIASKWGGVMPKKLEEPLHDGDEKEDEVYDGNFYVNAKAKTKPGIQDKQGNAIVDEDEIYSGVWCYVSMSFYPYNANGKKGVACGLNNLRKFKDDDVLGGRASADADFADIDDDEDL